MIGIALLLLAAAVGFAFSHLLRVPAVPVLVLAGVAASAVAPIPGEFLTDTLILGVTVVLFVAGVELNPARVGRYLGASIRVGTVQFAVLGGVGLAVALLMGFPTQTAAYLALALAASSTLIVVRLLQRRRQLYEPTGRMVTGVLLLQDVLVVLLIPVVTGFPEGPRTVALGVGATLLLMGLAGVVVRWVAPPLLTRLTDDEEPLLLAILAVLFVFLGLAHLMGVPMVVGAFLAGVALSPFPVNALVRGQLNSLGDFFSALFFAALGAVLPVPAPVELAQAVALSLVVLVVTPPLVAFVSERTGFSARAGIGAGLLLSQTSEFSLVVALQGLILMQLDPAAFGIVALVTVITMMLTPLLATEPVTGVLMRIHPFRRIEGPGEPPSGHILLVGCGTNGMALLEMLVVTPNEVWVVDDDPAVVDQIRGVDIPVIRGDASDVEVLRSAGADRAQVVVSTIGRVEDNSALLALAHEQPVLVRAFNVEEEAWVRERGGIPISYSTAAARDLLEWFVEGKPEEEDVI